MVGAALINALKVVKKDINDITAVVNGAGAAGTAIGKYLLRLGVNDVIMCDKTGILCKGEVYENKAHEEIALITNKHSKKGTLSDALKGADLFVGVSVGNIVSSKMIASMNTGAIVFAFANPIPEISPEKAISGGAVVVGTGSSQHPNQINNALVFPGLFRGALDTRARDINIEMMMAASKGIASVISDDELAPDNILPKAVDQRAHDAVAKAVAKAAIDSGVARKTDKNSVA